MKFGDVHDSSAVGGHKHVKENRMVWAKLATGVSETVCHLSLGWFVDWKEECEREFTMLGYHQEVAKD